MKSTCKAYESKSSKIETSFTALPIETTIKELDIDLNFSKLIDDVLFSNNVDIDYEYISETTQVSDSCDFDSNLNLLNNSWNSINSNSFVYSSSSSFLNSPSSTVPASPVSYIFNDTYNRASYEYSTKVPTSSTNNNTSSSASNFNKNSNLVLSPQNLYIAPGSRFFIIKSFNEEDIKSSFLHRVWTSTELGNKRLNKAFKSKNLNERIFLFFSVNGSGKFSGIAEMRSEINSLSNTDCQPIWVDNAKYKGSFEIQWIFIKDIRNSFFKSLKNSQNDYKPVTISRDTQEIPFDTGVEMVKIFKKIKSNTSFLQEIN
ncbi:hypothetical protein WICMUC_004600 [Wickerhamomyces mucosus]|uniref:YTH domain-containing protein n=1 Tax=Wickerhamomyces mucosus TaxID=1378264 RepID=A0A9P8PFU0_9ASCO|nr:hypothetical protein WICMUC_004600 [Wickerhamomyces mucosus]